MTFSGASSELHLGGHLEEAGSQNLKLDMFIYVHFMNLELRDVFSITQMYDDVWYTPGGQTPTRNQYLRQEFVYL